MNANDLRKRFFEFFRSKGHNIVPSAPMVVKNDPTLMFTNAGMNQFKDIFLGNQAATHKRTANSQKCLRVSGKHNDLEEVGHDTYHHTMFEMLGNWSFGDYFKKDAIEWAWEFLTKELQIPEERLYATIFEGSPGENVPRDDEAFSYWEKCFTKPDGKIIEGSKKDNFWEMGETGPCGPCSEIHVDIRSEEERKKISGRDLVNKGHPLVIEIWNLVFIQYNRKANGELELLPAKHVDTGMGFERLCMVVQGKKSNYETDIFQSLIAEISALTGKEPGKKEQWDIAMRVIADHLRAVSFSIADGQLPSNNKAGYVIRRILRRAVRYGFNHLEMEEPFIYKLVPALSQIMGEQYPELVKSGDLIRKVIHEEETAFLKTLGKGIRMIERKIGELKAEKLTELPGDVAFELYDTFGFPSDLTELILREMGMTLDTAGFEKAMSGQKERSREDASKESGDWTIVSDTEGTVFTGYTSTEDTVKITKYRKVKAKGKELVHLVFNRTPFYAEAGGQAGDSGIIAHNGEKINITDTVKENNLVIHIADRLPSEPSAEWSASVDTVKRQLTANNHSATHLLHFALRKVLGSHVEQKGSLVNHERLRFDFSHFSKMTKEEILAVETLANSLIRENADCTVLDGIPIGEAQKMGAMALFGEKYGENVRVIRFGDSIELCGGTHTLKTGSIGFLKIVSEGAIAAGIRRIEAVTGKAAEEFVNSKINSVDEVAALLRSTGNITENVGKLLTENNNLRKTVEKFQAQAAVAIRKDLESRAKKTGDITFISGIVEADSADTLKNIAHQLKATAENLVVVIAAETDGKASLLVMVSEQLVKTRNINAIEIIKEISTEINGGGGGQPFLATAGGKNPGGLKKALEKAESILVKKA
jgi:alanyl-tRNA synthetase